MNDFRALLIMPFASAGTVGYFIVGWIKNQPTSLGYSAEAGVVTLMTLGFTGLGWMNWKGNDLAGSEAPDLIWKLLIGLLVLGFVAGIFFRLL